MDYMDTVRAIQARGSSVAYPTALPAGWTLEDASYEEVDGDLYLFSMSFTTPDGGIVGIMETPESQADFIENSGPGQPNGAIKMESEIDRWETFGSDFDDPAFITEFSDGPGLRSIAVHGSDSYRNLVTLIELLTTARA